MRTPPPAQYDRASESDAAWTVTIMDGFQAVGDGFDRLVPADPFEFAFAALSDSLQGMLQALRTVDPFGNCQTAHARGGVARIRMGSGLDFDELAVSLHGGSPARLGRREETRATAVRTVRA